MRKKQRYQSRQRKRNMSALMNDLRANGPLSRAQLASRNNLTKATVSAIIADLIDANLVRETELVKGNGAGRPSKMLELNPNGGGAIGVAVRHNMVFAMLTSMFAVTWFADANLPEGTTTDDMLRITGDLIQSALDKASELDLPVFGIGMIFPGLVDRNKGVFVIGKQMPWTDVPMVEILSQRFDLPIHIDNDANAAALAEYSTGAALDVNDFVYIHIGKGVGGGFYVNGQHVQGKQGFAGEIGQMLPFPTQDGTQGTWEDSVSVPALQQAVKDRLDAGQASILTPDDLDMDTILLAAEQGDAVALAALKRQVSQLAWGIGLLINIFNPELVILGGEFRQQSQVMLDMLNEALAHYAIPQSFAGTHLTYSHYGRDAAIIGATSLSFESFLNDPVL